MNKFDWNDWESTSIEEKPKNSIEKSTSPKRSSVSDFKWDEWENIESPKEIPKEKTKSIEEDFINIYRPEEKTPEEVKKMSLKDRKQYAQDLKTFGEVNSSRGFIKGALSGSTLGATEHIPGLETEGEEDTGTFVGEAFGITAPFTLGMKLLSLPFKGFVTASKWLERGVELLPGALTGGSIETGRELIAGEELNPKKIGLNAAVIPGIDILIKDSPKILRFFHMLPKKQADKFAKGIIPDDMSSTSYKFLQNEIVPELKQIAEKEHEILYQKALKDTESKFQNELNNIKATHEAEIYESEEAFKKGQEEFQNKVKQIAAKHENELAEIEEFNKKAFQEFEEANKLFEQAKTRQKLVEDAITNPRVESEEGSLKGRVSKEGQDIGIRPSPTSEAEPTLRNKIGNIFSKNEISNPYEAGQSNTKAIRATADADRKVVNDIYTKNDLLNDNIETLQPSLLNFIENEILELEQIPQLSGPKERLLNSYRKVKERLAEFDKEGNLINLKPISNKVLLDQAKELRYSVDYDFVNNPTKIYTPFIDELQAGAERGAQYAGNKGAYESNVAARTAYREWSETYNNDYIRKYRDLSNKSYQKNFESSLNVDDFIQINNVLSKTNAGQQLSSATRRELINKHLDKFISNPNKALGEEFDIALKELEPILKTGETQEIRQEIVKARKTPVVKGKIQEKIEKPNSPKLKKEIKEVTIPKSPTKKEIKESVKIPLKEKVKETREMKAISKKMNIEVEQVKKMTETPTGINKLKKELQKTEPGKKLLNKTADYKMRDLLYEGKVRRDFNGDEFFKVMNEQKNFDIISEFFGENTAIELLDIAQKIGKNRMRWDNAIKYTKKIGAIKILKELGIFHLI
jgi:hypothetical protein